MIFSGGVFSEPGWVSRFVFSEQARQQSASQLAIAEKRTEKVPAGQQTVPRRIRMWAWLKIEQEGLRRFWSIFPLSRVLFWNSGFLSHSHVDPRSWRRSASSTSTSTCTARSLRGAVWAPKVFRPFGLRLWVEGGGGGRGVGRHIWRFLFLLLFCVKLLFLTGGGIQKDEVPKLRKRGRATKWCFLVGWLAGSQQGMRHGMTGFPKGFPNGSFPTP